MISEYYHGGNKMILLKIIGSVLFIVFIYLFVIIFLPVLEVKKQPVNRKEHSEQKKPSCRKDISFYVEGDTLKGWLYLPENTVGKISCIVMSHGFGGTKDMVLENYALKFVEKGYGVLTYDYRFYGDSGGQPRQLYCGKFQLDDLRGAVDFVRNLDIVDDEKIVLWGTSAAGGYGLNIAGEDGKIAGVISQCAALDHKEDSKLYIEREGYGFFFKLFMHGQRDKGRSRFELSPHLFPAYGKPGTTAMITAPGAFEGIEKLAGDSTTFKNEACARLSLMPHADDPIKSAETVQCPVLFLTCENDELVSSKSHKRAAEILGDKAVVKAYPIGHFDIYFGEWFEKAVNDQIEFIKTLI
jgi:fermentation-respiration switch protein FrsA (DUF1100 family)